jgi:hypothetical protein
MSEPAGLGDLGHAVVDEPGLVAVPQAVEGQPGPDGQGADPRVGDVQVSVGGRAQRTAVDVAAAQPAAARARKDGVLVAGLEVLSQQRDQKRRERDRAYRRSGLGRSEPQSRSALVQGADDRVDHDHAVVEVSVDPLQAGQLTIGRRSRRR